MFIIIFNGFVFVCCCLCQLYTLININIPLKFLKISFSTSILYLLLMRLCLRRNWTVECRVNFYIAVQNYSLKGVLSAEQDSWLTMQRLLVSSQDLLYLIYDTPPNECARVQFGIYVACDLSSHTKNERKTELCVFYLLLVEKYARTDFQTCENCAEKTCKQKHNKANEKINNNNLYIYIQKIYYYIAAIINKSYLNWLTWKMHTH